MKIDAQLKTNRSRKLIAAVLSTGFAGLWLAGCSSDFMDAVEARALTATDGGISVTYLGVSTLLIDDGKTQVLIDGYLSRPDGSRLKKLAPDLGRINGWIDAEGIRPFVCAIDDATTECPATERQGTAMIVAAHGHYDHALDTPTVAALTGAWMVRDPWIDEITRASRAYFGDAVPSSAWDTLQDRQLESLTARGTPLRRHQAGLFSVTLIPTPHVDHPFVPFMHGDPNTDLSFPASIFAMKEGPSFSVHVDHPAGSMLIVPTFGVPEASVKDLDADVVFLGIGFAGWENADERARVWQGSVGQSGAHRAILNHWDTDEGAIPRGGGDLKPLGVLRLDRSWETFCELAGDGVDLRFAPAGIAVDPFAPDTIDGNCN